MAYLFMDPVGRYPSQLLEFLGGRLKMAAVAVFTSEERSLLWRDKWSKELGRYVVETHLATRWSTAAKLAADLASRHRFDGVVPWDEETVLLGARLGELLGIDWNPLRVMRRCRDKSVMKAWLRRHGGVRVNQSAVVTERDEALGFQRRVGRWPIVVKPTAGSGSEDVYFSSSDDDLLRDCTRVLQAGSGEVLLEEYIGGEEIVVNGIVDAQGDLLVTDEWHYDRRGGAPGAPKLFYRTAKIPTHAQVFAPVAKYAADVVESLGLKRCPIHMEVKVDDRGPCLIEVGARFPGGNLSIIASKLHGRSLLELAACQYVSDVPLRGDDLDFARYDRTEARVVHGIQEHELPVIRRVVGADEVRALPSFDGFGTLRSVGTRAPVTRDLDSAAWELYLIHDDAAQIERDVETAQRVLRYE